MVTLGHLSTMKPLLVFVWSHRVSISARDLSFIHWKFFSKTYLILTKQFITRHLSIFHAVRISQ